MDKLTAIAASGMRTRMQALDMLANNMANASSRGFKADKEVYQLYASRDSRSQVSRAQEPWITKSWTDFTQGVLQPTGNPLDLALSGPGFLSVKGPKGTLYTRDGGFHLSPKGELLAAEEFPVLDTKDQPVKIDPALPFEINENGQVRQNGAQVAQLAIVEFPAVSELTKFGKSYFQGSSGAGTPKAAADTVVRQGQAESSNSGSAENAVRLVAVIRQFEMLQKAITVGAEMGRRGVEDVARVNP